MWREAWPELTATVPGQDRADHDLTPRRLAAVLGLTQPRIASSVRQAEPRLNTILATVDKLGTRSHVGMLS